MEALHAKLLGKLLAEASACVDRVRQPGVCANTDMESLARKNEAAAALSLVQAAVTLRKQQQR